MTERQEPIELEALLWAWTNLNGRLPDSNTMSEDEIAQYWDQYRDIVGCAIMKLTALPPDVYMERRALNGEFMPPPEKS